MNIIDADLIGCGGTGSWFVANKSKKINLRIFDGDVVEPKNLLRQNFSSIDLYKNKATSIDKYSDEYSSKYTNKIKPMPRYLSDSESMFPVIIGATDTIESRINILKSMAKDKFPKVYIDAGNGKLSGQICLNLYDGKNFHLSDTFMELIEGEEDQEQEVLQKLSCADLDLVETQSHFLNKLNANSLNLYLDDLLLKMQEFKIKKDDKKDDEKIKMFYEAEDIISEIHILFSINYDVKGLLKALSPGIVLNTGKSIYTTNSYVNLIPRIDILNDY